MMSKQLTRDVYFRSDIENALSAIQYVNDSLAFELYEEDVHIYKAGFDAALIAVAKAFGIGSANHPIKNFIPVDPCSHHQSEMAVSDQTNRKLYERDAKRYDG